MHYLRNVVTLQLNTDRCTGCGLCIIVCPHAVFEIKNKKARITDIDNCMECGACALNCEFGAINVRSGVGCAAGILNGILGKSGSCDCTYFEDKESSCC